MQTSIQRSILVIRLGALGDLLLARDGFHAIRTHHPHDRIVLLTRAPFASMAGMMPWFDEVWTDISPKFWQVTRWLALRRRLRAGRFERVYDLQCNARTGHYFRLLGRNPPEWLGTARGCSHPRPKLTGQPITVDKLWFDLLATAGVHRSGPADMSWLNGSLDALPIPNHPVVLVPGCAPHRLYKRWAPERFAELARILAAEKFGVVVVGTAHEREIIQTIRRLAPSVIDLSGQTQLGQLGALGRRALAVVGNDTGPVHLMAAVGAPTVVLVSGMSHSFVTLPAAPNVNRLQTASLAELDVATVRQAMRPRHV